LESPARPASTPLPMVWLWRPTGRTSHGPRPVRRGGSRRTSRAASDDPDGLADENLAGVVL
jgi:hypothetical protein